MSDVFLSSGRTQVCAFAAIQRALWDDTLMIFLMITKIPSMDDNEADVCDVDSL